MSWASGSVFTTTGSEDRIGTRIKQLSVGSYAANAHNIASKASELSGNFFSSIFGKNVVQLWLMCHHYHCPTCWKHACIDHRLPQALQDHSRQGCKLLLCDWGTWGGFGHTWQEGSGQITDSQHSHSSVDSLRAAIITAQLNMNREHVISSYKRFCIHIESVIADSGGWKEWNT